MIDADPLASAFVKEAERFCAEFNREEWLAGTASADRGAFTHIADACRKARRTAANGLAPAAAAANSVLRQKPILLSATEPDTLDSLRANAAFAYHLMLQLSELNPKRIPQPVRNDLIRMFADKDFSSCGIIMRMLFDLYGGPKAAFTLRHVAASLSPPPPV